MDTLRAYRFYAWANFKYWVLFGWYIEREKDKVAARYSK